MSLARRLAISAAAATLLLGGLLALYVSRVAAQAPAVTTLRADASPQPSDVLSADGQVLARLRQNRHEPIRLSEVSPHVIDALIATEDHRFRTHHGVDWWRTTQAIVNTAMGKPQGGSTITQQLARNVYPREVGRGRTLNRKIREIATALRIERHYSKDEILEAYLNSVPFLYNATGIEAAALTYFNKPSSELDLLESATLVGMLKGTAYFNPVQYPERARQRRNLVLARMHKVGMLDGGTHAVLAAAPLTLDFKLPESAPTQAPHFVAYVRKTLEAWAAQHDYDLERDGLRIQTTLRLDLQTAAEAALTRQTEALQQVANVEWGRAEVPATRSMKTYAALNDKTPPFAYFWQTHPALLEEALKKAPQYRSLLKAGTPADEALRRLSRDPAVADKARDALTRLEAGMVAIEPGTGAIQVWVGSRDHDIDQFDHVVQAARQPGSTFKPIVYAAALESGLSPLRTYMDAPVDVPLGDGKVWRPTDMHGFSNQAMTMWEGLVYSKNTITTQVMLDTGLDKIADLAQAMGMRRSRLDVVPSMALGTSPVTLLEMASVYATIADEGRYREPYAVTRITDRQGRVLATFGPHPAQQVLSRNTTDKLVDMMRSVLSEGTGTMMRTRFVPKAQLLDVAGKTGTTQHNTDAWFFAIHPQIVVGAWTGFNDQRVAMRGSYWGQGGHNALLLVGDFMARLVQQNRLDTQLAFSSPMTTMAASSLPAPNPAFDWDAVMSSSPPAAGIEEDGSAGEEDAPKSAQELGEALKAMGRDPETGAPATFGR